MTKGKHKSPNERRQQITDTAELLLLDVGIDSFTMDQLAERAGIAKGTVYKYFKNKDEVLSNLSIRTLKKMHNAFQAGAETVTHSVEKVKAVCLASYRFFKKNPEYYKLILYMERPEFAIDAEAYQAISSELQSFFEQIVIDGQRKGEIKQEIHPTQAHFVIWGCCTGMLQFIDSKEKFIKDFNQINKQELIETYANMISSGMAS